MGGGTILHRILYVSRSLIAPNSPEMLGIAEVSLHRNGRCGVTGYLYFDAEVFVQVLEGMGPDVDAVYASIQADERHADLVTVVRQPIETRAFGEWAMGFYDGAVAGGLLSQVFGPNLPARVKAADAPGLLRFLRDLSLGRHSVGQLT